MKNTTTNQEAKRRAKFRPPEPYEAAIWQSGTLVDASELQRNDLKSVMDQQESRRRNGFQSVRYLP